MVYVEGMQGYSDSESRPEISAGPFWKQEIHIGTMKSFFEVLEDANRGEKGVLTLSINLLCNKVDMIDRRKKIRTSFT